MYLILTGFWVIYFSKNPKKSPPKKERRRTAQASFSPGRTAGSEPLSPLLCDSRLPSPLSSRASVTKGVVLRTHTAFVGAVHLVLFSNFQIPTRRLFHSKPKQFNIILKWFFGSKFTNQPFNTWSTPVLQFEVILSTKALTKFASSWKIKAYLVKFPLSICLI